MDGKEGVDMRKEYIFNDYINRFLLCKPFEQQRQSRTFVHRLVSHWHVIVSGKYKCKDVSKMNITSLLL